MPAPFCLAGNLRGIALGLTRIPVLVARRLGEKTSHAHLSNSLEREFNSSQQKEVKDPAVSKVVVALSLEQMESEWTMDDNTKYLNQPTTMLLESLIQNKTAAATRWYHLQARFD